MMGKLQLSRWRVFIVALAGLTVALSGLNAYIWLVEIEDPDYRFLPAAYTDLYYPRESGAITKLQALERDEIVVELASRRGRQWHIGVDGQPPVEMRGKYPILKLAEGTHTYYIGQYVGDKKWQFELQIAYVPAEEITQAATGAYNSYQVLYSSIPVGKGGRFGLGEFVVAADQSAIVQRILSGEVGLLDTDETQTKIKKNR